MKYIRNNYRSIVIISIISIIGLIIGILLFLYSDSTIKDNLYNNIIVIGNLKFNYLYIFIHIGLISLLSLLGFIFIGFPLLLIYYLYEWIGIGYLLSLFIIYLKFKGLLLGIGYILLFKGILMLILSYFIICMYKYIKIKNKGLNTLKNYLYRSLFTLFICLINDIFLYFIGNKLIELM